MFIEGHLRGCFCFIHPQVPDYKFYLSLPGFDSVSIADLNLRKEANRVLRTLFCVQLPDNYDPTAMYPEVPATLLRKPHMLLIPEQGMPIRKMRIIM
jgi:hypothetical protein